MGKLKLVILIIVAAVLVDFAVENAQPVPVIKLFKNQLAIIPTYLLAYISLALGLVIGWTANGLRIRRKRREAESARAALAQQGQEIQARQADQADNQAQ
ncbi:MAG: LapA family protein [Deltaproteobacteria bacterium]|jgi:uncharacterized integral membrane protein